MVAETFHDQAETDHHQEAKTEDDNRGMLVDKVHQRLGSKHHDADGDYDGNHHDRQVLNHAHCGNDAIQREHSIQHDNLNDHLPEHGMHDLGIFGSMCPFQTLVKLHRAFCKQEETANQHDDIASREGYFHQRDQRLTQGNDP